MPKYFSLIECKLMWNADKNGPKTQALLRCSESSA